MTSGHPGNYTTLTDVTLAGWNRFVLKCGCVCSPPAGRSPQIPI